MQISNIRVNNLSCNHSYFLLLKVKSVHQSTLVYQAACRHEFFRTAQRNLRPDGGFYEATRYETTCIKAAHECKCVSMRLYLPVIGLWVYKLYRNDAKNKCGNVLYAMHVRMARAVGVLCRCCYSSDMKYLNTAKEEAHHRSDVSTCDWMRRQPLYHFPKQWSRLTYSAPIYI